MCEWLAQMVYDAALAAKLARAATPTEGRKARLATRSSRQMEDWTTSEEDEEGEVKPKRGEGSANASHVR